jgi:[acyl-carrier-protein] S-malonyltransferase
MRVVEDEFREAVDRTPLNLPEIPIVANITVEPLFSPAAIRAEMVGQLTASVRWTETIQRMVGDGVTSFYEIGPKNVLSGLIRRISREVNTYPIGTSDDIATVVEAST